MGQAAGNAIATPHVEATAAGERAFLAGGNAIDAALAAAATLTVAYPHNCALGGDLFALVRAPDGTVMSINASGPAPAAADPLRLRDLGEGMPLTGPDTVTVPGLVAGWERLHRLGARRPWEDALADATRIAADGVLVSRSLAAAIACTALDDTPALRDLVAPEGRRLVLGDTVVQPALAETFAALAADGPRAFYEGELARRMVEGLGRAGCVMTEGDLAGFAVDDAPPLTGRLGDLEVSTCPPNSSGILLLQALAALEATGLDDPLGADAGALADIFLAGIEDRDRLLGDPRSCDARSEAFLGEQRIAEIVTRARARADGTAPADRTPLAGPSASGDTVAVVAADAGGGAVSLIQSLFRSFGSGILDPATGVIFHNRGSFFSLAAGHPNRFAPGRRPVHTLMPVLVERAGALEGVLGTMGGRVQPQIIAHVLLRLRDGATPQEAVDAPRWVLGRGGPADGTDTVRVEAGADPAARDALTAARWRVRDEPRDSQDFGHAQAIWCAPATEAGSDRRADGRASVSRT